MCRGACSPFLKGEPTVVLRTAPIARILFLSSLGETRFAKVKVARKHLSMTSPRRIFYFFLFLGYLLLPFSSAPSDGGVISFGLPFLAISGALAILLSYKQISSIRFPILLAFIFLSFIAFTALIAPDPFQSFARVVPNIVGFMIFVGVYSILRKDPTYIVRFQNVALASGVVCALYYLINFIWKSLDHGIVLVIYERYVGGLASLPWGASNTIAQVLIIALCTTIHSYKTLRDGKLVRVSIFIIASAVLLTLSRSNLITLVLFLLCTSTKRRLLLVSALLCVCALLLIPLFGFEIDLTAYEALIDDRLDKDKVLSGNSRFESWAEKLDYWLINPLPPIGYYGSTFVFGMSGHSYWITTLIEQSVFSVVVSAIFFFYPAFTRWKKFSGGVIGLLLIMLGLMVEDPQFAQPYILMLWLYMGILYGAPGGIRSAMVRSLQTADLKMAKPERAGGHVS